MLEALHEVNAGHTKLLVVGGEPDLVASYKERARGLGLNGAVVFTGMRSDVRPYLWSADAFVLPSAYETFSLVAYEAAAAGLPVIAPRLNGIDELLRDGENGFIIHRTRDEVVSALRKYTRAAGGEPDDDGPPGIGHCGGIQPGAI